ncbi:MAG: hypothetical protein V4720_06425 [Pseudomonadota bacterium]
MDLAAEIAARYGAGLLPGVTVQRMPMGASARPLPVWDPKKNQLVVPDWKEQRDRERVASIKRSLAGRRRGMAQDQALMARLIDMHGQGLRLPAIAEAAGLTADQVYRLLRSAGYRVERRDPGPAPATLQRIAAIRLLIAEGKSRDAIATAVGFADVKYLAQFCRRHATDLVLPTRRQVARGPSRDMSKAWAEYRDRQAAEVRALVAAGASEAAMLQALKLNSRQHLRRLVAGIAPEHVFPVVDRFPGLAARDARICRLVATMTFLDVAELEGLTLGQVSASVKRSRLAGLIPPEVAAGCANRQRRKMPKGAMAKRDALILPLVRDLTYAEVGARLGLRIHQVKAGVVRLRAAGLLPPGWARRMPMRPSSENGSTPRFKERTARILDLHREGCTVDRISAELGAPHRAVSRTIEAAGLVPSYAHLAPRLARLAELPALVAQGLTGAQIARHWGTGLPYVYKLACKAKISLGRNAISHNAGAVSPHVAARRAEVRALYLAGATHAVMLGRLQVSHATLCNDIRALGLSRQNVRPPAPSPEPVPASTPAPAPAEARPEARWAA